MPIDYVSTTPWNDATNPWTPYSTLTVTVTGWPTISLTLTGFNPNGGVQSSLPNIDFTSFANLGDVYAVYVTTSRYNLSGIYVSPPNSNNYCDTYSNNFSEMLIYICSANNDVALPYVWTLANLNDYDYNPATVTPYPFVSKTTSRRTMLKVAGDAGWNGGDSCDANVIIPSLAISAGTVAPWEQRRRRLLETV